MNGCRGYRFGVLFVVLACGGEAPPITPADPPLFDLIALAGQPPPVVDSVLGSPTDVTPIENVPENMPGEFRDYELSGTPSPSMVRFKRGRAVFFTIMLPKPESSAQSALQRVGIDIGEDSPDTRAPAAEWWRNGTIEGRRFIKVGAFRGMGFDTNDFDMVQAEFPSDPP